MFLSCILSSKLHTYNSVQILFALLLFQQEERVSQVHSLAQHLTGCRGSKLLLMLQKGLSIFMRKSSLLWSIGTYGLAMFFYLRTTKLKLRTSIFQISPQIWLPVYILRVSLEPLDIMLPSNYSTYLS